MLVFGNIKVVKLRCFVNLLCIVWFVEVHNCVPVGVPEVGGNSIVPLLLVCVVVLIKWCGWVVLLFCVY